MTYPSRKQSLRLADLEGVDVRNRTADSRMNYRLMQGISIAFALVAALCLGFLMSLFGLDQGQSMAIMALFVVAVVPPHVYLHLIAKNQTKSSTGQ
jgi:hypothetical protein